MLRNVFRQSSVLKPRSTLAKISSGCGPGRFPGSVSVRKLMLRPAVSEVTGVTASDAPNRVPITSEGSKSRPSNVTGDLRVIGHAGKRHQRIKSLDRRQTALEA